MISCPKCERVWPEISEQGVCVELHGECEVCRFTPNDGGSNKGTLKELEKIVETLRRKEAAKMIEMEGLLNE